MKDFRYDMLEFRHAAGAAVENVSEILFPQTIERLLDLALGECRNRIAIVLLIARQRQRVECQWIIFRRRDLLFDQRAENTDFDVVQCRRHSSLYSFLCCLCALLWLSHFEDHSPSRLPDEPTAHLIVDVATKFSKRRIYNRCKKKIDSVLRLVYRAPRFPLDEDLRFWPVAAIRGIFIHANDFPISDFGRSRT